ncbi:MAG: TraR/DksA family transcriptional regulator [Pirellulales bacterium]
MTQPDFTLYRERLLVLRARLQGDMTQMEDNALNKDHNNNTRMPTDTAELGSDNADQELTLSVLGSEKDALNQVDGALKRIEDGSYGRCETCDGKLSNARLEAIPYAAQCVRCTSRQEDRHRKSEADHRMEEE